jgi:hypothetical protein
VIEKRGGKIKKTWRERKDNLEDGTNIQKTKQEKKNPR